MARINMEETNELQEAIAKIKEIKSQIGRDNKSLAEVLDMAERLLQDRLFTVVRSGFNKSK